MSLHGQRMREPVLLLNVRSMRKQIMARNLKLSDTEAQEFWPVYEQYVSELSKIDDAKCELVKQHVQTRGALTDTEAESTVKQWPDLDESLAQLSKRYTPTFREILSPKNTALFYQLERHIQLMIDLQCASALPLIEP
jgi:hypothetical protein